MNAVVILKYGSFLEIPSYISFSFKKSGRAAAKRRRRLVAAGGRYGRSCEPNETHDDPTRIHAQLAITMRFTTIER